MTTSNLQEEVMISSFYGKSFVDDLAKWLGWADSHGFLFKIKNQDSLSAVAVMRPISNPSLTSDNQYHFDAEAKSIYVDIACAIKKNDMHKLLILALKKFKHCTQICFRRNGGEKIHTYTKLNRLLNLLGALA